MEPVDRERTKSSIAALSIAVVLVFAFSMVELAAGLIGNSLALVADAGHMATDALALGLAAFSAWLAMRPPSAKRTWGYSRVEVLAAFVNSLIMISLVAVIAWNAIQRAANPVPVSGATVVLVSVIGMLVNLAVFAALRRGHSDLNIRAAMLHVLGDLAGSAAALASGLVIVFYGWYWADPLLSLLISTLILIAALRILAQSAHVLMNGTPDGLDLNEIRTALIELDGVTDVHDLRVWQICSRHSALSARVAVDRSSAWQTVLEQADSRLRNAFGISHWTLQPEIPVRPGTVSPVVRCPLRQPVAYAGERRAARESNALGANSG